MRAARTGTALLVPSLLLLLLGGCRSQGQVVPLSELVAHQMSYQGDDLAVRGSIVAFGAGAGQYFVIQDAHQNRVEVLPTSRVARYRGSRVTVEGTFHADQTRGRWIWLHNVAARAGKAHRLAPTGEPPRSG